MKNLIHSCPWKTLEDFANHHEMVLANWLTDTDWLCQMDFFNIDIDREIFQYYIVDRNTVEDIEYFDINLPYFVDDYKHLFVVGIDVYGMSWSGVNLRFVEEDDEDDDE